MTRSAGPVPDAVFERLSLRGFRNHAEASFPIGPRRTAIVGPNGTGKTNILEAMSLMSPGRGLRRATTAEMTSLGSDGFSVFASLVSDGDPLRIGTGISSGSSSRRVRIDGADASSEVLLDHLRVIWLTTDMDRLFSEPPETRRRFLDRFVLSLDPSHGRRMSDYVRCLRQRNAVLQDGGAERLLASVDVEFARLACGADLARRSAVDVLARSLEEQPDNGFPRPVLSYARGMEGDGTPEDFAERLRARRPAERSSGRTLEGPHRSDLGAVYESKGADASVCSTGEQKAMVVSLVLAQATAAGSANGAPPVVLVDEAGAHLSVGRRETMFGTLEATGAQVVMTGTEEAYFDPVRADTDFIRLD